MSEEKEIKLNGFVNDLYEGMMYGSIKIKSDDCKEYMDLISELQQENKKLEEDVKYWQEACDRRQDKIFELLSKLEGDK